MVSSPRYRRRIQLTEPAFPINKSAAVLVTVKGKSLRDGLRPPLTATPRNGQPKLGRDEEMVAWRSNKEMR